MSPRAACRLATMGFEPVYDYVAGKADWLARGLPREGAKATEPRVVDALRSDVVTCSLGDHAEDVLQALEDAPFGFALVLDEAGVLLGRVRRSALRDQPDGVIADVLEPGPSTIRADAAPADIAERLTERSLSAAIVTDPDGRLLGVVTPGELRALISEAT
jgi:CBS domain-containing protein